jgi:uridine phosphorylase
VSEQERLLTESYIPLRSISLVHIIDDEFSKVTVGSPSRARVLASLLDDPPKPFELYSERGFLIMTGRYHGTPVSIISIGMGYPNMDFFVREVRECLLGDMAVVRSFRVSSSAPDSAS